MKEFIASFIDQKELSENSQSAYFYDLDQFIESIHGKVTPTNLRIYQASIKDFKPAVQKRKLSADRKSTRLNSKTKIICRQPIFILFVSRTLYF